MFNVRPAEPAEYRRVLHETLSHPESTPAQREQQIETFQRFAHELRLDLSRHWIAEDGPRWLAAMSFVESPGRTAMIFLSPDFDAPQRRAATAAVVQRVLAFAHQRGVRIVQSLLESPADSPQPLVENGFARLAQLDYLDRPALLGTGLHQRPSAVGIGWQSYADDQHRLFAETILRTYEGSLDCPGLNGVRHIDDVMAGHRAATRFDPQRWVVMLADERPAGCLLLGEIPFRSAAEIVYMGLVPEARGRGWSGLLLAKAVELARGASLATLTLAVDAANAPALRAYQRFGFRRSARRDAWIRVLDGRTEG